MASIEKEQAICKLENPNPHELVLRVENIKKQAKKRTTIATGVKYYVIIHNIMICVFGFMFSVI